MNGNHLCNCGSQPPVSPHSPNKKTKLQREEIASGLTQAVRAFPVSHLGFIPTSASVSLPLTPQLESWLPTWNGSYWDECFLRPFSFVAARLEKAVIKDNSLMLGSSASASPPPTTQFLGRGRGQCYRPPDLSTPTAVSCICTSTPCLPHATWQAVSEALGTKLAT